MSRFSSVGTASWYGLNGRGSDPSRGEGFRFREDGPLLPTSYGVSGVQLSGRDISHTQSSRVEVKERVERYIYFLPFLRGSL